MDVSVFLRALCADRPHCEVQWETGHRLALAVWPGSQEMG